MMREMLVSAMCVGLLMSAPVLATAQTQDAQNQRTIQGKVEAVDQKARTVTIRGSGGNVVTLDVPPNAERFEQVTVGSTVSATYYDGVSIRLKPAGEPAVDQTVEPTPTATAGDLPGATRTRQRVTTVTITGWDPKNRVVSFNGPNGTAYTRRLLDSTDPKIIAALKAGDRVDVTRTEAVTLVDAAAGSGDPRRQLAEPPHRLGPVRVGQPVQRQDDPGGHRPDERRGADQPGRDDLRRGLRPDGDVQDRRRLPDRRRAPRPSSTSCVRAGFGRRGDPDRHGGPESAGAAERQLHRRTSTGASRAASGGSSRARASRRLSATSSASTVTRTSAARSSACRRTLTPGLAAQDGKFFEKSWAFSLGPTGGLLIGVGPFEVMAETQFRFLGGLSDVDWLVEEGLRDVNSESSRWSIPLLVGARIRF